MAFKDFLFQSILTSADVDNYLMSQMIIRCTSAARPPAPVDGVRILETDTGREMIWRSSSSSWVFYGGTDVYVEKPSDETYNNNTSMHNDADLVASFEAGATYLVMTGLVCTTPAVAKLRAGLSIASGTATIVWGAFAPHANDSSNTSVDSARITVNKLASGSIGDFTGYGVDAVFRFEGILRATTSGTLRLQWAQQVSNAGPTVMRAGSEMHLRRVS